MTHGLDTSVVVRILSGLPEDTARRVGERIAAEVASGELFSVSSLVLSEAYCALQHHYDFTKDEALQSLRALAQTDGICVSESVRAILDAPNLAKASPGFVDRLIVDEYAINGSDTYSCEKSFRHLQRTVVF